MKDQKLTYQQMKSNLTEMEQAIEAIHDGQVDAIVSTKNVMLLRLKEAEEAIRQSEQRYRNLLEKNPDPVFCVDTQGSFIEVNEAACRFFGYRPKELLEKKWQDLCDPEDLKKTMQHFKAALQGESLDFEVSMIRKDGRRSYLYLTGGPLIVQDKIQGFFVIAHDLTELKKTEENLRTHQEEIEAQNNKLQKAQVELEEAHSKYVDLFDFAPIGYFVLDKKGNILETNLTGCSMLGVERNFLAQNPFVLNVCKEDTDTFHLNRKEVQRTGINNRCELKMIRKNGSVFFTELIIDPVKNDDGQVTHCRIAAVDITIRKLAEGQIKNLSKFPAEDPFPVLRIKNDGTILYSNLPGKMLLEQWNCKTGQKAPEDWCKLVSKALKSKRYIINEVNCSKKIFSFAIAPVPEGGYVNLYGRDITTQRLTEELLRKNEQKFMLFSETASQLLQSNNPQGLVENLCRKVMEHLDCQAFFNYHVDEQKQCLHLNACAGIPKKTAKEIEWLEYGVAICGCGDGDGKRIIAENIGQTPDPLADLVHSFGIKAYACHPLMSKGRLIGTLSFGTQTRTKFSKDDLDVMKTFADQVATAMERVKAEETIRRSEERVRAQLAETESIYNTAVIGLCVLDSRLRYIRINQYMANMNGSSMAEHIGKTLRDVNPDLGGTMERTARKVFRTGEPVLDVEVCGQTKAEPGKLHYWKQQWLPIKGDTKEVGSINVVTEDITEFKRIQQSLLEINRTLGKKVQTQSQELSLTVEVLREEVAERVKAEQDLKESSKVLDAFFAHTITPLVILDSKFNFIRVNKAYADGCQRNISEFEGHNHFEFYPDKENESVFKKIVRTKRPCQAIARPFAFPDHPELGVTYWDWALVPILEEDEKVDFLVFSMINVTERKRVKDLIEAERQRMNDVLETLPAYVCLVTPDYQMPFANRVFRETFGYSSDKKCYEFLFNRTEPCEDCQTVTVLKTNKPHRWEWRGPNGRNYDVFDFPFKDTNGLQLILEMGMDITEQRNAENEIREKEKELRDMAARLQLIEAQERRKLAQNLHDSIGPILSFSGRELRALQKSLPGSTTKSVQEIINQLDIAVEQARTLSFDLSPSILYDLGFEVAIEDLVDRMSKEKGIQCQFENCSMPKPLTDDVKVLLYRIVRELLINAAKHANSSFVKVSLLRSGSYIYIKVEDDGDGFDISDLNIGSRKGFGLFSIRERLIHIGGHLKMDSAKGKGTRAMLTVPLDFEEKDKLGVDL